MKAEQKREICCGAPEPLRPWEEEEEVGMGGNFGLPEAGDPSKGREGGQAHPWCGRAAEVWAEHSVHFLTVQ